MILAIAINIVHDGCKYCNYIAFFAYCCFAASQERIRAVRESLQSCKNLLHCKRDELRRLWIEGVEMKTIHSALDAVERVTGVTERLPFLIASRSYLTATESVVTSLAVLETELADVDALQQVVYHCNLKMTHRYG